MKELNTFQKHDDPITAAVWHPLKEELFASSSSHSGQIIQWHATYGHLHTIQKAHASMVWGLAWHPEGHQLVSTGNDHKLRFWGRQKPSEDRPRISPESGITGVVPGR